MTLPELFQVCYLSRYNNTIYFSYRSRRKNPDLRIVRYKAGGLETLSDKYEYKDIFKNFMGNTFAGYTDANVHRLLSTESICSVSIDNYAKDGGAGVV